MGSTHRIPPWSRRSPDHPRVRGEHAGTLSGNTLVYGSSPRTRGAPHEHHREDRDRGIIPAYAGSTDARPGRPPRGGDHSRIRGEHLLALLAIGTTSGSSPHTRGAPRTHREDTVFIRIIPAYAGNTQPAICATTGRGDHPRIRGEHSPSRALAEPRTGSSPHTRGTPPHLRPAGGVHRIIPAYAGNTASSSRSSTARRDHPRIRGEHRRSSPTRARRTGSSPHTRGTPDPGAGPPRVSRIIPAYAGNT